MTQFCRCEERRDGRPDLLFACVVRLRLVSRLSSDVMEEKDSDLMFCGLTGWYLEVHDGSLFGRRVYREASTENKEIRL